MKNNKKTKKKKSSTVKSKRYTQEAVDKALDEIQKGMSTRQAATLFQVPRSTLYAKLYTKLNNSSRSCKRSKNILKCRRRE